MLRLYLYARVRFLSALCKRDRGCSKHPAFPAPLIGAKRSQHNPGIAPRDREHVSENGAPNEFARLQNKTEAARPPFSFASCRLLTPAAPPRARAGCKPAPSPR